MAHDVLYLNSCHILVVDEVTVFVVQFILHMCCICIRVFIRLHLASCDAVIILTLLEFLLWSSCIIDFLWPPYVIRQAIIFLPCGFFFYLSFFPCLISAVAEWMSTILLHMVWP